MAPPPQQQKQRTQSAADALLLVTRPNKNKSKNNADAAGTHARKRPRSNITSTVSNPYNRTTSVTKKPLNDRNRLAGGAVAGSTAAATRKTPKLRSSHAHAPSSSTAFQRRNARDGGTKNPPPPTGTDKALVALLDGPAKKQTLPKKKKRQRLESNYSMTSTDEQLSKTAAAPSKTNKLNRSNLAISSSTCIAMKPPPMPSYYSNKSHQYRNNNGVVRSSTKTMVKPRKRVSSHMNQISSSITKNESSWMSERKAVIGDAFAESFGGGDDDGGTNDNAGGATIDLDIVDINHDNDHDDDHDMMALLDIVEKNDGEISDRKKVDDVVGYSNNDDNSVTKHYTQVPATCANIEPKMDDARNDHVTLTSLPVSKVSGVQAPKVKNKHKSDVSVVEVSAATAGPTISLESEEKEERVQRDATSYAATSASDSLEEPLKEDNTNNDDNEELDFVLNNDSKSEWYDPDEHAEMDREAELHAKKMKETKEQTKQNRKLSSKHGINDNFVRLDLRNAAGSCRGARNLKKVNKQKLWRAQNRFGMNDRDGNNDSGDEANPSFGIGGKYGYNNKGRSSGSSKKDGGDVKCFSSASNAGVDPLDDFMDGVFSSKKTGNEKKSSSGNGQRKPTAGPTRDSDVPMCTRHQRPCKLLTVKKNTKGNKGRKFYVCSMPRGEQCDFFKWEEDTVEATQRALLKSSSSSGFIARQVAASRVRFKELTVPELRIEAKRRGLKATGTKEQLLTRLLIWVRDEISESVENDGSDNSVPAATEPVEDVDAVGEESEEDCASDSDEEIEVISTKKTANSSTKMIELSDDDESSSDEDELEVCHTFDDEPVSTEKRSAKFDPRSSPLRKSLKHYFGYSYFREGQEWAIDRCLSNKRSLLVAPTGQGKSLCYALPAAVSDGLCLVVSPLISLMQDQLRQLPPKIPAATLSGSMTSAQMALIVDDILRGRLKVLFVSPERLASAAFRRLMRPKFNLETRQYERQFPEVSLLCVDEAHCLSQWGHNFRPSYLRVRSLMSLIQPKSVLALTATAGPMVVKDICNTLCIPFDGQCTINDEIPSSLDSTSNGVGVKVLNCNRDNIDVFSLVLQDQDERRYLVHKLLKEKKSDDSDRRQSKKLPIEEGCLSKGSVIIYVWRQKDTEIVAEQLNGAGVLGGVVCYHGGMNANDRSKAQSKFLRGKARICVATVAFGLGINKADIEGVIHLCLPPSPEHYLQEIGRAGRDGRPAKAIALPLVDEFISRHSLAHSDRLSNSQLSSVFLALQNLVNEAVDDIPPEAGVDLTCNETNIDNLHVAIPVAQTVDASDCKEESIETMLSLLEEENSSHSSLLSVEGYLPDTATITLKRCALEKLSKVEEVARSIEKCGTRLDQSGPQGDVGGTALEKGFYAYSFGTYKFSVVRCARCMGPTSEPRHVYAALRRLQDRGELELSLDVTANGRALHIRLKKDGIHLFRRRPSGYSDGGSIEGMKSMMSKQFSAKEQISVDKVQSMYDIAQKVANITRQSNGEEYVEDSHGNQEKSARLVEFQSLVQTFFKEGTVSSKVASQDEESFGDDIKDFPLDNGRLLSCLASDTTLIIQALSSRRQRQDQGDAAVQIREHLDYRNLCIAKILHGIDAPRAPIREWYSHILWGKYRSYSFTSILKAVEKSFEES
ncbi:ATP-dependent DNA helicase, RecQ family [Skeletonema marinoi]|uniref:DNA 3'-5' helicase n=1 Tax=Skeletonema marinoi TaxID=267567 RepID=A0AAD8YF62_9STRA|nr:ATP-dependent DNA helicase, RecQ family [Skeletonema marinoi]